MTDMWQKISDDERVYELHGAKYEALGRLLGVVDMVMLAEEYPDVFCISQKLTALRAARKEYDLAAAAYLDARIVAK